MINNVSVLIIVLFSLCTNALVSKSIAGYNIPQFNRFINVSGEIFLGEGSMKDSIKTNDHYHFFIGLKTGYRGNTNLNSQLSSNGYFGLILKIPVSQKLSVQPELNYWSLKRTYPTITKDISFIDLPILLGLNIPLKNMGFSLGIGPGILFQKDKNDNLLSFNFNLQYYYDLLSKLKLFAQSRIQTAGSLETGGGSSISSVIFELGFFYNINK